MIFRAMAIPGAFVIEPEPIEDERGSFARTFDREAFAARDLDPEVVQCSVSFNRRRGTLRGLHYQAAPHEEAKLVRCTAGTIWDVIADLRPGSPAFRRWEAVTLSAANRLALYVPRGCAHGFLTLEDGAEVSYQMSVPHHPESARGVRWDDPVLAIAWPEEPRVISEKDRSLPALGPVGTEEGG